MSLPPKAYIDKIRERTNFVANLFGDRDRVRELLKRVQAKAVVPPEDIERFALLVERDVPAILDALLEAKEEIRTLKNQSKLLRKAKRLCTMLCVSTFRLQKGAGMWFPIEEGSPSGVAAELRYRIEKNLK